MEVINGQVKVPARITLKYLGENGACAEGLEGFRTNHPKGLVVSKKVLYDLPVDELDSFLGMVCKKLNVSHNKYGIYKDSVANGLLELTTWENRVFEEYIKGKPLLRVPKHITKDDLTQWGCCMSSIRKFEALFGDKTKTTVSSLVKFHINDICQLFFNICDEQNQRYYWDFLKEQTHTWYKEDSKQNRVRLAKIVMIFVEIQNA